MAENNETIFSDQTQHTSHTETIQGPQKNSRARLVLIIMGVLLLIILAFAAVGMLGKGKKTTEGGAVPPPPSVENVPGGAGSPAYNEKVEQLNQEKATNLGTSLPVLTNPDQPSANNPFPTDTQPVTPPASQPEVITPPAPVEQPAPVVQQPATPTPVEQVPQYSSEQYGNMQAALQAYVDSWKVAPAPAQEFSYNGAEPKVEDVSQVNGAGAAATPVNGSSSGSVGGASNANQPSFVRAGTVIPAIMLGALNSDSPGPVLAQITSGPLAGTRLIGQFQSTGKALVISFTSLSKPGMGTYSVNAVAVDDNYTVPMQTDVNNHYLRRYGLLLAASFIQGYGQAMSRANTTVVTGPFGSTVSQGPLTSQQARDAALGQMGQAVTQNLLTESEVPPTVKLDCGGGCPIGLLFLSDL